MCSLENRALHIVEIEKLTQKYGIRQQKRLLLNRFAADILLHTHGEDLSALKELIESGFSIRSTTSEPRFFRGDLHQLFRAGSISMMRIEVMQHIAREALITEQKNPGLVKVISDIDDTLYPG